MTIVEFFQELSRLLANYRVTPSSGNSRKIDNLVKEAKDSGLDIDIDVDKLKEAALNDELDEINSYDSYEESYEEDEDEEEDEDDED